MPASTTVAVPPTDHAAAIAANAGEFPIPTGREEDWRFTPLAGLGDVLAGTATGTPADIDRAVRRVKDALWRDGGCIAQCEFGPGGRPENVYQVYKSWEEVV